MLEVRNLHFTYEHAPLLRGIDLNVAAGESVVLQGPSGAGKSTLLRCIAGLETPEAGQVVLAGNDVTQVPTHQRRIGMMFQEPALFPHLNVQQNVAFGVRYRPDAERLDVDDEANHHLGLVGLEDKTTAPVGELSGGQRQRVSLARTLAAGPRAVLLDEPLSALDRELRQDLGQRIKVVLADAGVPALWVTHDDDEAARLGDRVFRLVDGRLAL